jgi:threonylcarbamoyladenosine tRNA methylthiotransferase MtaB
MLVPELHRLRLSSLDPIEVDEDLWKLIENEKRLLPHFHISLQAGDDTVLKRMKRRHLRHDVIEFCQKVRLLRPDAVFGADIIAGFPTESEDMFLNTLRLVEEADLTFLHVFPYSPRPGTPAALMPQVEKKIIKDRAKRLRDAGEKAIEKHHQALLKSSQEVLIESISDYNGKRVAFGKTNHFYDVIIVDEEESLSPGMVVVAQIISCDTKHLIGRSIVIL